jgi:Holliday junction resolvase-like predicted endonuclease
VTWAKHKKVRTLAGAFLQRNAFEHARVRFDVASVWLGPRGADVEIFEDAF